MTRIMEHTITAEPADARLAEFESKPATRLERMAMWLANHLLPIPETIADAEAVSQLQGTSHVAPMTEANTEALQAVAVMQTQRWMKQV